MKHLSKYRLHIKWKQLGVCVALIIVTSLLLPWAMKCMTMPPPEVGFDSPMEAEQYHALIRERLGYSGILGGLLCFPVLGIFFLTIMCTPSCFVVMTVKKYVVLSTLLANNAVAVGLTADASMIDWLGHVNYMASQRNIDCCRDALMDHIGWPIEKLRDEHRLAFMMKEVHTKYRRQIRQGDEMRIEGSISQPSPARIELSIKVHLPHNDDVVAVESTLVMPLVALETGRPVPIPEWLSKTWQT